MPRQIRETTQYDAKNNVLGSLVTIGAENQSSVEITTNSKGLPQLTVKVYRDDPAQALSECLRLYAEGNKRLQETMSDALP